MVQLIFELVARRPPDRRFGLQHKRAIDDASFSQAHRNAARARLRIDDLQSTIRHRVELYHSSKNMPIQSC